MNPDEWGDLDEIICVFSYAGEEPHALVTLVDYNAVRHDQGRLGQLPGGQAARPLPAGLRPGGKPSRGRLQADRRVPGEEDAAGRARRHRRGGGPAGQRLLRRAARLHQGPHPGAAPGSRPRPAGQAAMVNGAPGTARRGVPGLRRGRGAVRPAGREPLHRPDHRLRLRPGQRTPDADVACQGAELHARLAAAQGAALRRRPERDAARGRRLDPLDRPEAAS